MLEKNVHVTHCGAQYEQGELKKGKIIKNKNKFQYKLLILMVSSVLWEKRELMDSNLTASMGFRIEGGMRKEKQINL